MSSVIVKGMKMPENCWECMETDLNIVVSVFGGMCPYCEKIRTDHDMQTGRHPDCPLGALPDKHGRLVDADALEPDADYYDGDYWAYSVAQVCNAPTIVEKES